MTMLSSALRRVRSRSQSSGASSISDTSAYRALCEAASQDATAFAFFRQHPAYTKVLEHVTPAQGHKYLELLRDDDRVLDFVRRAAPDLLRGGPVTADFGLGHPISPSLLRYAKVLVDLRTHFGDLDGFRIVEVGVGYGGQCQIICGVHRVASYTLVDLPEPLALSKAWLEPFEQAEDMKYVDALRNDNESHESDLLISNYAFSEIDRPIQKRIIDRWVSRAKRGYLTYNHIGRGRDIMSAIEFARIVGGKIIPESPLTHRDNCIVVWGM